MRRKNKNKYVEIPEVVGLRGRELADEMYEQSQRKPISKPRKQLSRQEYLSVLRKLNRKFREDERKREAKFEKLSSIKSSLEKQQSRLMQKSISGAKKKFTYRKSKSKKPIFIIKEFTPEPYVSRYFKNKFEEDKKNFFFK